MLALSAGKRRTELQSVLNNELVALYADRILVFGERSAAAFAQVVNAANAARAAIAIERNFMLTTRNHYDQVSDVVDWRQTLIDGGPARRVYP
jgi:predicted nucleic acid-binding protein